MKKTISIVSVIAVALVAGIVASSCRKQSKDARRRLQVARCVGYCNLPLFLASSQSNNSQTGAIYDLKYVANPGDHGRALNASGGPSASVTPFSNIIVAHGNGMPVKIIAGSGMNGLALVSSPDIKNLEDLKGKTIASFRGDTLEAMAYATLKQAGLEGDVTFRYFADALEPLTALRNGEVHAVTHVEPFVTQLVEKEGMRLLARGEDVFKADHPDCVLMATTDAIAKNRTELKGLILEMMKAQYRVESDLKSVAHEVAQPFYKMDPKDLEAAVRSQYPAIDIRGKAPFILARATDLVELGYIKKAPSADLFDFTLLNEVISENPDTYKKLRHTYAK